MTFLHKKDKQLLFKIGVPLAVAAVAGVAAYMLWSHSARSKKHIKPSSSKPDTTSISILPATESRVPVIDEAVYATEDPMISSNSKNSRYIFTAIIAILASALIALIVYLWQSQPVNTNIETASVERRIQPMDYIVLDMSSGVADAVAETPEHIVETKCSACHVTGAGGAPKLKNTTEWGPRIRTGLDALVHSVIEGKGAMPPKGGFTDLTEDQIRQAVIIMANESGANF